MCGKQIVYIAGGYVPLIIAIGYVACINNVNAVSQFTVLL